MCHCERNNPAAFSLWRGARRLAIAVVVSLLVWGASGAAFGADATARMTAGVFEIEYAPADEPLARSSLETLEESLDQFSKRLPSGNSAIHVTICHTVADFTRLAGGYARAPVGGIAKSHMGVIVVKAPGLLPPGQDYRGMLRHELIHVLLARNTDAANVPRWFDEGLAMVVSKELRWESGMRIARMYAQGRLIPYWDLDMAFAPLGDEGKFDAAYAQALSMTRYLADQLGEDRFWELVHALRTTPFEDALATYAGLTPRGLYDAWARSLWKVALLVSIVSGFSAFQLMAILVVVAYLRKRRRGRQILRQWEEEDREPPLFTWESVDEGPFPWEDEDAEQRW